MCGRGGRQQQQLNFVVTDGQRSKKKLLTPDLTPGEEDDALAAVLTKAKAKLNLKKKPSRVTTALGKDIIDSMMLTALPNESVFVVM